MNASISARAHEILASSTDLRSVADRLASGHLAPWASLIPGMIPAEGVTLIYAPSACGKTFLAVHLGLLVASGGALFGPSTGPGMVAYFAAEDRRGVELRAYASGSEMDLDLSALPFYIATPPSFVARDWSKVISEAVSSLQASAGSMPKLVVLDTLGATCGGVSQDDAHQVNAIMDELSSVSQRFGCAVVALHHVGKDARRGMRGSAVLQDRADAVVRLTPEGTGIVARCEKLRNGPSGTAMCFRLAEIAPLEGMKTCKVADLELLPPRSTGGNGEKKDRGLPRDCRLAIDGFQRVAVDGSCTVEKWRESSYRAFGSRSPATLRQAFRSARRRLEEDGLVEIQGDIVRMREREDFPMA
jgi:hypothetical protein